MCLAGWQGLPKSILPVSLATMSDIKLCSGLGIAVFLTMLGSFFCGVVPIVPADMVALWRGDTNAVSSIIIVEIRAPRIVLAALAGFVLGLSGAGVQAMLRNPLAEPSLLGAANAAALGAVIAIYLGITGTMSYIVPVSASACALLSVGLLLAFAGPGVASLRLILAGFAVSALAGAGIALALNLSPNIFAALEIAFWLLGAVENRSWQHVWLALPGSVLGCFLIVSARRGLAALSLGEDVAQSLGIALGHIQLRVTLGMALAVGAVVSVTGVIGFVGLVAPHLARPLCQHHPVRCLLPSGLIGALILLLADSAIRLIDTPNELKLGVLTAFLGVPMLLYLLRRQALLADAA